jgi:hypothetical protein
MKCSETGSFIVTGFADMEPGKIDHIKVAELVEGKLVHRGQVRFGVGRELPGGAGGLANGHAREGGLRGQAAPRDEHQVLRAAPNR